MCHRGVDPSDPFPGADRFLIERPMRDTFTRSIFLLKHFSHQMAHDT